MLMRTERIPVGFARILVRMSRGFDRVGWARGNARRILSMTVLVTGAAGYIGSHTALRLLRAGRTVVGLDNFDTGSRDRAAALAALARDTPGAWSMIEGDLADTERIRRALDNHAVDSVLHLAARCIVGESLREPERYHRNNVGGTASLLAACAGSDVARFILSSTTAVYGDPDPALSPIPESTPCRPINPYGAGKLECERLLHRFAQANPCAVAALRYFNVAGCDPELGEQSNEAGRLIPAAIGVALGKQDALTVFGTDFPTPDGTAVRDYVDVRDVADAHVAVLASLKPGDVRTYNIGMGRGWSVREVVEATARITGRPVPTTEAPRREGDPAALVADVTKIAREIGWEAKRKSLDEIIGSAWAWAHSR
jgi:UDP-glucose-4-epimerase GalE